MFAVIVRARASGSHDDVCVRASTRGPHRGDVRALCVCLTRR